MIFGAPFLSITFSGCNFLPPLVRRKVKGLSELLSMFLFLFFLLLRHVSSVIQGVHVMVSKIPANMIEFDVTMAHKLSCTILTVS